MIGLSPLLETVSMNLAQSGLHSLKNCHITPLPFHKSYFLLSPRWPLWRGLTVSYLTFKNDQHQSPSYQQQQQQQQ